MYVKKRLKRLRNEEKKRNKNIKVYWYPLNCPLPDVNENDRLTPSAECPFVLVSLLALPPPLFLCCDLFIVLDAEELESKDCDLFNPPFFFDDL